MEIIDWTLNPRPIRKGKKKEKRKGNDVNFIFFKSDIVMMPTTLNFS